MTLFNKGNFEDVIKFRIRSCDGEMILDYPGGTSVITRVPRRGRVSKFLRNEENFLPGPPAM